MQLFDKLLDEVVEKFGGTRESNRGIQLQNVGYFTGYCSREVAGRIMSWLPGCSHPIFGRSHATPKEALEAGMKMGEQERLTQ